MSNKNRTNKSNNNNGKKGNNRKGGRGYYNNNKQATTEKMEEMKTPTNDPSWHAANEQLLRDVASFPFAHPTGDLINLNNELKRADVLNGSYTVPGLMIIDLLPTYGFSDSSGDPMNVAAQSLYSFVRHTISGSRQYDPTDLMLYLMTIDQLYSYISWLQRVYGLSSAYTQLNRYYGANSLVCEGIDLPTSDDNLANFRAGINLLIDKVAQFVVPDCLPVFRKHATTFSGVYIEGDSIKQQLYMFHPVAFGRFELDESGAGSLVYYRTPGDIKTPANYTDLLAYGKAMINAIFSNEDYGTMSGDILNAFRGNTITLTSVPESFVIVPSYDENVLEQIKNAVSFNDITINGIKLNYGGTMGKVAIKQSDKKDYLRFRVVANYQAGPITTGHANLPAMGNAMWSGSLFMSTHRTEVPPAVVMELSRYMMGMADKRNVDEHISVGTISFASDIFLGGRVFMRTDDPLKPWAEYKFTSAVTFDTDKTAGYAEDLLNLYSVISSFDYHPPVRHIAFSGTSGGAPIPGDQVFYDFDNYTIIGTENLKNLHEVAAMSELAVTATSKI